MEEYFKKFREGIIGIDTEIPCADGGTKKIVYADWTASGRNYLPIEKRIQEEIMPLVANTHTETSATGMAMTHAYHEARELIKRHVNANSDDILITAGSGMTRLVNKFQRMLGLRFLDESRDMPPPEKCPVVFITHMEHHSNQTSWLESIATVEIIRSTPEGLVDLEHLEELLETYAERSMKIASVTACSNVTGITTPYHTIAGMLHRAGGYCFVDFACSAPYVPMDMHPANEEEHLDAIFFSPHKFLGGPGSSGVLIFNGKLYNRQIPDNPGGGTVDWTNPWGQHKYVDDVEAREDGGTPAFLQTIKTALCICLKEEMGIDNILAREHELLDLIWDKISAVPNIHILAGNHRKRMPVISFYIDDMHYNLGVRLLNDKFGIQSRGGCSCAGTYGHYLLHVDPKQSAEITDRINHGDYSTKPGWIRISLHPTLTNEEVQYIGDCMVELAAHHEKWGANYEVNYACGGAPTIESGTDAELKDRMNRVFTVPLVQKESAIM